MYSGLGQLPIGTISFHSLPVNYDYNSMIKFLRRSNIPVPGHLVDFHFTNCT